MTKMHISRNSVPAMLWLIGIIILLILKSNSANASCALGLDPPTGGGPTAAPVAATAGINCSGYVQQGSYLEVSLMKDNVVISTKRVDITGSSPIRQLTASAPCTIGNYQTFLPWHLGKVFFHLIPGSALRFPSPALPTYDRK